jgi:hypothetical protein
MSRIETPTNVQATDPSFPTRASAATAVIERADGSSAAAVRMGPEEGGAACRSGIPAAVPSNQEELATRAIMQECDVLHGAEGNKSNL